MGLRAAMRLTPAATGNLPAPSVKAPWAGPSTLTSLVWSDLLDVDALPIDRAAAMTVPAMSRARHLLCGTGASCQLYALRNDVRLVGADAPLWTYRADGTVSPWHRMLWTLDDLLFTGFSLWRVSRDSEKSVIHAWRVDRDTWRFADDGVTVVDNETGVALSAELHVLIPGPHEGVLSFGANTLRTATRLERSAGRHAQNPVPSVELRQTVDVEITEVESDALVAKWIKARQSPNGSVAFTSYGIEAHQLGEVPEALLIDGRNAASVDVARHASIPAAMIDATNAGASLTYETTEARNQQFIDYGLDLYLDAVSARLSMDDVTPRGTRIAFDVEDLTDLEPDTNNPATGLD